MKPVSFFRDPPKRQIGVILITGGVSVLLSCFLPPHATVVVLSLLLTASGCLLVAKKRGGMCC